jgi:hypothetical protein
MIFENPLLPDLSRISDSEILEGMGKNVIIISYISYQYIPDP